MHIRYDLKNKVDLNQFRTQAIFFLSKEDCVFSFYLSDFSVTFEVSKGLCVNNFFKINFCIAEPVLKDNSSAYKIITPLNDTRIKEVSILSDLFNGETFAMEKSSKEEVCDFVVFILSCMRKIKKMSALA